MRHAAMIINNGKPLLSAAAEEPNKMRAQKDTDFHVTVDGLGTFRYGRRTFGDRIKIRAEFLRMVRELDAEEMDLDLSAMASVVAAHKVLCVDAPAGWADLEQIDLLDNESGETDVFRIYAALKEKEDSFRKPANANENGQGASPANVGNDGVLVPAEIQPVAS